MKTTHNTQDNSDKPDSVDDRDEGCAVGLMLLLAYFGSAAELSRQLDVHYQLINVWKRQGRIGEQTARRIAGTSVPLTLEQLRPDLVALA